MKDGDSRWMRYGMESWEGMAEDEKERHPIAGGMGGGGCVSCPHFMALFTPLLIIALSLHPLPPPPPLCFTDSFI